MVILSTSARSNLSDFSSYSIIVLGPFIASKPPKRGANLLMTRSHRDALAFLLRSVIHSSQIFSITFGEDFSSCLMVFLSLFPFLIQLISSDLFLSTSLSSGSCSVASEHIPSTGSDIVYCNDRYI